ncbi:MAG: helix-turn-helix domain-containing protein [Candidatus Heimdallarchaeaceae archaeon]
MGKAIDSIKVGLDNLAKKVDILGSSIAEEYKQSLNKVESQLAELKEKLTEELNSNNKKLEEKLKAENQLLYVRFDNQETKIIQLNKQVDELAKTIEENTRRIDVKEEEIQKLNALLQEKEEAIRRKDEQYSYLEKQIEEQLRNYNELKLEKDAVEVEFNHLGVKNEELQRRVEELKETINGFEDTTDKTEVHSSLLRILLNSTNHGRIYLALSEADKNHLTLDELADQLNLSAVEVKQAITFMHEIGVIIYKPETRLVMLAYEG